MTPATRRSQRSRLSPCQWRRGRRRWIRGLAGGATFTRPTGSIYGLDCMRRTGWLAGAVPQMILKRQSTAASRSAGESSSLRWIPSRLCRWHRSTSAGSPFARLSGTRFPPMPAARPCNRQFSARQGTQHDCNRKIAARPLKQRAVQQTPCPASPRPRTPGPSRPASHSPDVSPSPPARARAAPAPHAAPSLRRWSSGSSPAPLP
jgi:hypothetical protein